MKCLVLQENLLRGLRAVKPATASAVKPAWASKAALPILSTVKLHTDYGRLRLDASSLALSISAWVGAKIEKPGAALVPGRVMTDLIAAYPHGTVAMEKVKEGPTSTGHLLIECGRTESRILPPRDRSGPFAPADFPAMHAGEGEPCEWGDIPLPATRDEQRNYDALVKLRALIAKSHYSDEPTYSRGSGPKGEWFRLTTQDYVATLWHI